jgi:hemoglobin
MTDGTMEPMSSQPTPYAEMGGTAFFATLVHRFYEGVASDPVLRPMYPDADLAAAERRLQLFLEQYWGGPTTYSEERGHPRLRMRHLPFAIDDDARDRWLVHMKAGLGAALDEHGLDPTRQVELWRYLEGAAMAMVNTDSAESRPALPMNEVQQ